MKIDIYALGCAGPVKNQAERALRRVFRIKMFERAGSGIAGIREQRQSRSFPLFVQFLEAILVEIGFSAHFENLWRRAAQLSRHRANRFDILSNVVPYQSI